MGEIDRIQQLTQSAKLINASQRVNPADPRHQPKKDQSRHDDHPDVVELSQDELSEESGGLVVLIVESENRIDPEDGEHLDIAV